MANVENLEKKLPICIGCFAYVVDQSVDSTDWSVQGFAAVDTGNYSGAQSKAFWIVGA